MAQMSTLSNQLPEDSMNRLDSLSKKTSRSRSDIASKVVEQYLKVQEWQVQAIKEAVKEADSPNAKFMDHEEVILSQ